MAKERYKNLPGVKVNYNDGNLYATNQKLSSTTRSLLIIAGAADGPVGEPVAVKNIGIKEADKLFGGVAKKYRDAAGKLVSEPVKGSLVRSMYEALDAGCDDVRLLRVGGKTAKTELEVERRNVEVVLENIGTAPGNKEGFEIDLGLASTEYLFSVDKVEVLNSADSSVLGTFDTDLDLFFNEDLTNLDSVRALTLKQDKFPAGVLLNVYYSYENKTSFDSAGPELGTLDGSISGQTRFVTANNNWDSGKSIIVTLSDISSGVIETIPVTNGAVTKTYWRVGKPQVGVDYSDIGVADPANNFQEGGIFFTQAFFDAIDGVTYTLDPRDTGSVEVYVEYGYFEYDSDSRDIVSDELEGYEKTLTYSPKALASGFKLFYRLGNTFSGAKQVIASTDYNNNIAEGKITIESGVVPFEIAALKGYTIGAEYTSAETPSGDGTLVVEGLFPGAVYGSLKNPADASTISGVQVYVTPDPDTAGQKIIKFKKPLSKQLFARDEFLTYYTKNLPFGNKTTIKEFIEYVNSDNQNNIVSLSANSKDYDTLVVNLKGVSGRYLGQNTSGTIVPEWLGNDGEYDLTNGNQMKELYLELGGEYGYIEEDLVLLKPGIYSKLENYMVDQIVLTDVYANTLIGDVETNDSKLSFATQLAQHCAVSTAKSWETIGFIGMAPNPNSTLSDVQEYVVIATGKTVPGTATINKYAGKGINAKYKNNHYMYDEVSLEIDYNEEGDPIDIGNYVSVVFGPEVAVVSDKIGTYVTSGASAYAGFVSALRPEVSSTNKQISSVLGMRYLLSESQHNLLVGGRYVTFQQKTSNSLAQSVYVKDGVTAAQPLSDYNRLSTVRIIHAVVQVVREKADPFIGLPNGLAQRNALSAQIQAALDALKDQGVVQKFNFTIFSSAEDRVLGNAFIKLEVVPQFETRKFYTSVVLRAN